MYSGTVRLVEHNIAVKNFTVTSDKHTFQIKKTVICQTTLIYLNVTVANEGDYTETFNLTYTLTQLLLKQSHRTPSNYSMELLTLFH